MNIFKKLLFGTASLGLLLLPQLANAQVSAPILGGTANITGGTISGVTGVLLTNNPTFTGTLTGPTYAGDVSNTTVVASGGK